MFSATHLELVGLQPAGQACKIGGRGLIADGMLAAEVVVEVLVDVNGSVVDGVADLVELVCGRLVSLRALTPGMSASIAITRSDDELTSASFADTINGCLIVLEDQCRWHVMGLESSTTKRNTNIQDEKYLVHNTENNLLVVLEPTSQLVPE